MSSNPLRQSAGNRNSPTDPQECCDWANARLAPDDRRHWVVTGFSDRPIALSRA